MHNRRFTRLTNAYSKKIETPFRGADDDLLQFCPHPETLRVTPAMAAGVTDPLWEVADVVALMDDAEAKPLSVALTRNGKRYNERVLNPAPLLPPVT